MWKWMCLFLRKNHVLRCWGWHSFLNCIGVLTLSLLLKLLSKKIRALICSMKFLLRFLYIFKTNIRPCMKYCCHVWAGAPSYNLELLDKLQKQTYRTVGSSVGITLVDVHLNWLNWFHSFILEGDLLVILIVCMIFLSLFLAATRMSLLTVSFLTQLDSGILCL